MGRGSCQCTRWQSMHAESRLRSRVVMRLIAGNQARAELASPNITAPRNIVRKPNVNPGGLDWALEPGRQGIASVTSAGYSLRPLCV